jgi:hypothetical protein
MKRTEAISINVILFIGKHIIAAPEPTLLTRIHYLQTTELIVLTELNKSYVFQSWGPVFQVSFW